MFTYKGYTGKVEHDKKGNIYTGEVIGLRDVITFQGKTTKELESSFRDSIDFYLEMCQRDNIQPERPDSGCFNIRLELESAKLDHLIEQQLAEEFLSSEAEWDYY